MMRTLLVALGATVLTTSAIAADLKAPPPPAPVVFNWTGFYIGIHMGSGWANNDGDARCERPTGDPCFVFDRFRHTLEGDGFVGGGQIGFNWQFMPSLVLGFEADISWSTIDDDITRVFPRNLDVNRTA